MSYEHGRNSFWLAADRRRIFKQERICPHYYLYHYNYLLGRGGQKWLLLEANLSTN
jgi:hypothetical protein